MTRAEWIELGLVSLSAPFLIFPTLKPQLTLLALLALALWWLGEAVAGLRLRRGPLPVTCLNGAMLLWAVMVGVGTLVTAYPEVTLPKATNLILGLAVWRVLVRLPRTRGTVRWTAAALAVMGAGVVGLGLLSTNWTRKIPLLAPVLARLPEGLVALPGAPDAGVSPNQLGGTLALFLPWAVSELVGAVTGRGTRRVARGIVAALGTLALGAVLVLTQSRSAWVGAAAGLLALGALWGLAAEQRRWRRMAVGLVAVAVISSLAAGMAIGGERLTAWWDAATTGAVATAAGSVSLSGRVEIWGRAVYAIQDFVFTGCGLGTFREVVWLLYPLFTIPPTTDIAHAHNIFLQVAVDTGIPGLIAYLALVGGAMAMAWRAARARREYRALALGLLAGLIALHVYGLTDALAPGSKTGVVFWVMVGLLSGGARERGSRGAGVRSDSES